MELAEKTAIVTGGAMGLGQAIATALAEKGATVAVADLREDLATETAQMLQDRGFSASPFPVDVSDGAQVQSMIESVVGTIGPIDILVNNAGIGQRRTVLDMTEEEWDGLMAVNLKGAFLCSRAAARGMVDRGAGGRIINIVSTAGENARVNAAAYCASKAGLIQFTRVLALELGPHGITANAVGPGMTITGNPNREPPSEIYQRSFVSEVPLARPGRPSDIAQAVAFLASPGAEYISGQVLFVDGGYSAGKLAVRD